MGESEPPSAEAGIEAAVHRVTHTSGPAPDDAAAPAPAAHSSPAAQRGGRLGMRRLMLAGLLLIVVAAGLVVALTARQMWHEPDNRLVRPNRVAGLVLDDNGATNETVEHLQDRLAAGTRLRSTIGAVYADETGRPQSVIFVGGTDSPASAEVELDKAVQSVTDEAGGVEDMRRMTTDRSGVTKCGVIRTDGGPMAVCGWVDRASIGIAFFPNRSVDEAVPVLRQMRTAMQRRR